MYRVSAQGVDERMINVHYYYHYNADSQFVQHSKHPWKLSHARGVYWGSIFAMKQQTIILKAHARTGRRRKSEQTRGNNQTAPQ